MLRSSASAALVVLAQRLATLREARQLTQQEVYDATGIHIGRLEANKANVTLRTLLTLTRYYQVPLLELLDGLEELDQEN